MCGCDIFESETDNFNVLSTIMAAHVTRREEFRRSNNEDDEDKLVSRREPPSCNTSCVRQEQRQQSLLSTVFDQYRQKRNRRPLRQNSGGWPVCAGAGVPACSLRCLSEGPSHRPVHHLTEVAEGRVSGRLVGDCSTRRHFEKVSATGGTLCFHPV